MERFVGLLMAITAAVAWSVVELSNSRIEAAMADEFNLLNRSILIS